MLIYAVREIWKLNLRHLRAAVAIARLGSISAAADEVGITQPAITQGLAHLESQVGANLFERRVNGMLPTEAGRRFVPRIEAALNHVASQRVTMTQMRALIALAESGNYSGASAAIGLTPPSLHRSIGDLAMALRRPLVDRRGKGVALTDAGRRTARAFRLAQAELDAGLSDLAALAGRVAGRISVGAMPLSRARVLPAAVTAFHRQFPDVAINIVEGAFHELIEPLRDGALDLMIGALRDPSPGADIAQEPLFEDRPVVIGRRGHPATENTPEVARLAAYPWIVPAIGTPLRIQWERFFESADPKPAVPIECGSVITIRQILIDSDFLTLLSLDQVAVELEAGWLTHIANAPANLTRTIGISTRSGWRPTTIQMAFADALRAGSQRGRLQES